MATKAASALRQRSRGGRASGQRGQAARQEWEKGGKTPITASWEHTGCTGPRKPTRWAPDHHGGIPAPPHSKQPPFQPCSRQLCNPQGGQTPKKVKHPSLHTRPRAWPLRAAPLPACNTQGGSWLYQEATGTNRISGTPAMPPPREGPIHQPRAAKGWGAQGQVPPAASPRLQGHPNSRPGDRTLPLPQKSGRSPAPARTPASLSMSQSGHPAAPRGAELIYHLKARKLPAAGGRRRQGQLSRLLLIKRKKKIIPPHPNTLIFFPFHSN